MQRPVQPDLSEGLFTGRQQFDRCLARRKRGSLEIHHRESVEGARLILKR